MSMTLNTYVNYAGNCAEAFKFYEQHLGGKITMLLKHSDNPGPSTVPDNWKDAVLHGRITIGGTELLGADIPNAEPMRSAYLSLTVDSADEAETDLFRTLRWRADVHEDAGDVLREAVRDVPRSVRSELDAAVPEVS